MASRTGEDLQEVNPQRGTRKRSQASDVNGKKNPSLSYNPIINGTQLHDYAFLGALSSSSTFSISNPTNIHNSSERTGVPVGSTSGAPLLQPVGDVHGTQAATSMNTSASMDIPILSAQPQLQTQPTPTMNTTAYTDIPMLSAQPQPQPSYHGRWFPPMQMDGFDLSPIQTQHPSATPVMQHANAIPRTSGDVSMNHASFYR